jgi:hypothetical protein
MTARLLAATTAAPAADATHGPLFEMLLATMQQAGDGGHPVGCTALQGLQHRIQRNRSRAARQCGAIDLPVPDRARSRPMVLLTTLMPVLQRLLQRMNGHTTRCEATRVAVERAPGAPLDAWGSFLTGLTRRTQCQPCCLAGVPGQEFH